MGSTAVVIIGAGPYGLSLAAHLSATRVPFRIFGVPMEVWHAHMPKGMYLKSDGFASNLYDPEGRFTLRRYCQEHCVPYADYGRPVPLATFCDYGHAFQKSLVPTLTEQLVLRVARTGDSFAVHAADGETVTTAAVVLATGISHYSAIADPLKALPPALCSHSFSLHDLTRFAGRRVIVVGGGASAADLAALLSAQGTAVSMVARHAVQFHLPPEPGPRSLWQRITKPNLGLGPNFRSAVYTAVPGLFHRLPRRVRLRIVRRHLGPAGAWFVRDSVQAKVPMHVVTAITAARPEGDGVLLVCQDAAARPIELRADHVIAATGYRVAIDRLELLDPELRAAIAREEGSPVLSGRFESSVPGLYFIGVAAANSFGPVMRFARGAEYTVRCLARRLATRRPRAADAESEQVVAS